MIKYFYIVLQRCSTGTGTTLIRSKHENIVTNNNNNQNENVIQSSSFLSNHNYLGTINKYSKDIDCISNASSTHFTMIGIGGGQHNLPLKNSICCRHKITCIVLTMSIIFIIGIIAAIIYIECNYNICIYINYTYFLSYIYINQNTALV